MKNERKDHGAVDKLLLEQQFCKQITITFIVSKFWNHTGVMAGWQADEIVFNSIIYQTKYLTFVVFTKEQCYYSYTNVF